VTEMECTVQREPVFLLRRWLHRFLQRLKSTVEPRARFLATQHDVMAEKSSRVAGFSVALMWHIMWQIASLPAGVDSEGDHVVVRHKHERMLSTGCISMYDPGTPQHTTE
jgi:hypothetical protein